MTPVFACPKCKHVMQCDASLTTRTDDTITHTYTCPICHHTQQNTTWFEIDAKLTAVQREIIDVLAAGGHIWIDVLSHRMSLYNSDGQRVRTITSPQWTLLTGTYRFVCARAKYSHEYVLTQRARAFLRQQAGEFTATIEHVS